jgi:uncharacterized protein YaaW (UPF0174 family)
MNLINQNMLSLYDLLETVNSEDRGNLAKITKSGFGDAPDTLCNHMHFLRTGHVSQFFGFKRSYKQIVTDVADQIEIDWESCLKGRSWDELIEEEIENAIIASMFELCFDSMDEDDKKKLADELKLDDDTLSSLLTREVPVAVLMAAGKLSGFQIYLMSTTAVGAISTAVGVTFPFALYTGLTSGIKVLLGPIGWLALAGSIAWQIFEKSQWPSLTAGICYISYIRHKRKNETN